MNSPPKHRYSIIPPHKIALGHTHRIFLILTVTAVYLSGVAWLILHFVVFTQATTNTSLKWENRTMATHGATMLLFMMIFGSLFTHHIRIAIQKNRNKYSGYMLLTVCFTLGGTGWALYYISDETLRHTMSTTHWVLGLLLVPVLFLHTVKI